MSSLDTEDTQHRGSGLNMIFGQSDQTIDLINHQEDTTGKSLCGTCLISFTEMENAWEGSVFLMSPTLSGQSYRGLGWRV